MKTKILEEELRRKSLSIFITPSSRSSIFFTRNFQSSFSSKLKTDKKITERERVRGGRNHEKVKYSLKNEEILLKKRGE